MHEVLCNYGPRILALVLPLDGELAFYYLLVKIWFLEKDLESPLILIFLKGKQNKKEKP